MSFGDIQILERRLTADSGFYRWQRRLLDEWLLAGRIPMAVDVPTGLGKTKTMTAWLIARAVGAPLPRRLAYAVDRRAVVDQATTEAETLARAMREILDDRSIDQASRSRWSKNLGLDESELSISTLRGQFVDNRKWMNRPHSASIIVGTVDMIGSRLLFSGYGTRSATMRSAQAGLLGSDCLVVLDEAHLVPSFEALLRDIAALTESDRASVNVVPAFSLMALSATGRTQATSSMFQLDAKDFADPPVRARLAAKKRVRLLAQVGVSQLADTLAERAWLLAKDTSRRILIFCNSRKIAQVVESNLSTRVKRRFGEDAKLTELFVGERRLRERTLLYDPPASSERSSIVPRFLPSGATGDRPVFLVATSAAEVGVDLDADDLVCDLVAWERMVQRFGRVNRRPDPGCASIEIVPSVSEKDADDEIVLQRLEELRAPFESPEWPEAPDGTRDASPGTLQQLKAHAPLAQLIAKAQSPVPYHPALSRAIVESWAMTALRNHPGRPIVQPWLRGWDEDQRPQCHVAWRAHFPLRRGFENDAESQTARVDLEAFFDAAPPHVTELLEAPADRVVEILKSRVEAWKGQHAAESAAEDEPQPVVIALGVRYEFEALLTLQHLLTVKSDRLVCSIAARTLIVDSRLGGLDESGLLDSKARIDPPTLDGDQVEWQLPLEIYGQRRIRWGKRLQPESGWRFQGFFWSEKPESDDTNELWVEVWRGRDGNAGDPAVTRCAQRLDEHHAWTRSEAETISLALELPAGKKALLCAAAAFHDTGKNRDLWQNAMNAKRDDGRPYAKTTGGAAPRTLAGYRHEFGSLADALQSAEINALSEDDRELALHLIVAHHGRARPSIAAIDPGMAPSSSQLLAQESALRFTRLQRRWGPWGLAWWEALLKSADWAASRRADAND